MSATQVVAQSVAHLSPLQLFEQADFIVKSIMVVLVLASLASWGVIIDKLLRFSRLRRNAIAWTAALSGQRSLTRLAQELRQNTADPVARVLVGDANRPFAWRGPCCDRACGSIGRCGLGRRPGERRAS